MSEREPGRTDAPTTGGGAAQPHVVVVGAGFTGLAAAWELIRGGARVTVLEADDEIGGLAGSFDVGPTRLEKFYHHWFRSDRHVLELIAELGLADRIVDRPTRTGFYCNRQILRLSSPLDVLRFAPLGWVDRLRLGLLVLRARRVSDWRELESITAADWLRRLVGARTYRVVWEPLLRGKFGPHAEQVSAVWFWNKLVLRGGSRNRRGAEVLTYFRGGFAELTRQLAQRIVATGGTIRTGRAVDRVIVEGRRVCGVEVCGERIAADAVLATPALPVIAGMVRDVADPYFLHQLERIEYLANVCLVLELDRSLSSTYWLNVADPEFPYVGVIEHTNFEPPATYDNRHIVYLSRYLPVSDPLYAMSPGETLEFSLPYIRRMFPAFRDDWIRRHHVWKARWAQPIVECHYSKLIPGPESPLPGLWLASMAQIYPEDRGTNYAVRDGRWVARRILEAQGAAARKSPARTYTTQDLGLPISASAR